MIKYYHFTSYDNLEGISREGLVPQIGFRTKTVGDDKNAVFLSKGMDNAIRMYDKIAWHYSQFGGDNGKKIIRHYKKDAKEYLEEINNGSAFSDEYRREIEGINRWIEFIKPLSKIKTFEEYIGDGCYLSISGIRGIRPRDDDYCDCYYKKVISPEKIKVVTIRNKDTDEVIDEREKVLTYFMSNYYPDYLLEGEHNAIAIKKIYDMYEERSSDVLEYNKMNYSLEEVPIIEYQKKLGSR